MNRDHSELDELLHLISEHIDLKHCREVDNRYLRALTFEQVDMPPLAVRTCFGRKLELPEPWNKFHLYSYRETFEDPAAMLQNELLNCVVPGLLLRCDSPLSIRNNHGTVQVACALGGQLVLTEDNFPWMKPVTDIESVAYGEGISIDESIVSRSIETLAFYRDKLAEFSPCSQAIQISMPDLQGPLDTAEMLWGSEIYYAFADAPDVMKKLLERIVDAMLNVAALFRLYTTDRLDPTANTQHGYAIPGRILLRNDSSIMLSSEMYTKFVRPHDERVLKEIGGGSIHFCGNGEHLIGSMLDISSLRGIDFGDPQMMDIKSIYSKCNAKQISLTGVRPSRADLMNGVARKDFPTGAAFVYITDDLADAIEVVRNY